MKKDISREYLTDDKILAPAPLDPAIASTMLRAKSNQLLDGFPITVSAFFGKEVVALDGDEFSTDVFMSLNKAMIELEFHRCSGVPIEQQETGSGEWLVEETRSYEKGGKSEKSAGIEAKSAISQELMPDGGLSIDAKVKSGSVEVGSEQKKLRRRRRDWSLLDPHRILIGDGKRTLEGREIDDFEGWRVFPEGQTDRFFVTSTLNTRVEWISFEEIDPDNFVGRIGQKAKRLLKSKDDFRKEMFTLLLRSLAARGLQQDAEAREAILAVDVLAYQHASEQILSLPSGQKKMRIPLHSEQIERFLDSEVGQEIETLVVMGVPVEAIRESAVENTTSSSAAKTGVFTAGSSPLRALETFEYIVQEGSAKREDIEKGFSKRVLTDLKNLGLIRNNRQMIEPSAKEIKDPQNHFRFELSRNEVLRSTRAMLLESPNIPAADLIDAISLKFGKKYSSYDSKVRVGNALKRWARWLEPHLIDPTGGAASEMLLIGAISGKKSVGARSIATPERINKINADIAGGKSLAQAARDMGLVPRTVYNWRRLGWIK